MATAAAEGNRHKQNVSGRETHAGLFVIINGVFRRVLPGELRCGELTPRAVLLFSGAAGQKKINVMQRLRLEIFRQMLRLFQEHFSGTHARRQDRLKISLNQARKPCRPCRNLKSWRNGNQCLFDLAASFGIIIFEIGGDVSLNVVNTVQRGLLEEALERLKAEFQPEEIYLFGSHAWGAPNEHGDVDLMVIVSSGDERPIRRDQRDQRCLGRLPISADVLVRARGEVNRVRDARGSLAHDVLQKGRKVGVWMRSADTFPSREEFEEAFQHAQVIYDFVLKLLPPQTHPYCQDGGIDDTWSRGVWFSGKARASNAAGEPKNREEVSSIPPSWQ